MGKVLKRFVRKPMEFPAPNSLANLFGSLVAHCREETGKELTTLASRLPGPERKSQKIEISFVVIIRTPIVFAMNNLRFLRMQIQATLRQPLFRSSL